MSKKVSLYLFFFALGMLLLAVPLLRDFHFESAILAGVIGCYWAGIRSSKKTSKHDFFPSLRILLHLYVLALPLFLYALISGCMTFDGFGFWLLIPLPSTFLGASIGRLTRLLRFSHSLLWTVLIITGIALGLWVLEFFLFPQVYFFNHVWGLWPGPIYDESVQLSGAFLYFRWLTFLWILILWLLPEWDTSKLTKTLTGLALLSLLLSYLNLDSAGIISPRESIQAQLGGQYQTQHFTLHYANDYFSPQEIQYWAAKHEFYFLQITELLQVKWPADHKIESYLYAHAWQKKKITGAKFTSYVPIWLERDQLHIAKQQLEGVLKHEMVHVISKQFGNTLFNGSWSIGMIEGLAEGVAKDASSRSTLNQIVAAQGELPSSEDMRSALSLWGFYANAGAISYTTAGSFVSFLLDRYPVENLKLAYSSNELEKAYAIPFDSLVLQWHSVLQSTPLDSVDQVVSDYVFDQRSLFQKPCPHVVSKPLSLWDQYHFHLADKDTAAAYQDLDKLHALEPGNNLVTDEWVYNQLMQGNYLNASRAIPDSSNILPLQILKADAMFLNGEYRQADLLLQTLKPEIEASSMSSYRHTISLRSDSTQWAFHTNRRFLNIFPDRNYFLKLNLPNRMLSLQKAIHQNRSGLIRQYSQQLLNEPADIQWFSIYEEAIDHLAFTGDFSLAEQWIARVQELPLRDRYKERLNQQGRWLTYLRDHNKFAD